MSNLGQREVGILASMLRHHLETCPSGACPSKNWDYDGGGAVSDMLIHALRETLTEVIHEADAGNRALLIPDLVDLILDVIGHENEARQEKALNPTED